MKWKYEVREFEGHEGDGISLKQLRQCEQLIGLKVKLYRKSGQFNKWRKVFDVFIDEIPTWTDRGETWSVERGGGNKISLLVEGDSDKYNGQKTYIKISPTLVREVDAWFDGIILQPIRRK